MFSELTFKQRSYDLTQITPSAYVDALRRVHFRAAPLESYAAQRFSILIDATLRGEVEFQTQECRLAWSLIMFDAVATRLDLVSALSGISAIYSWQDHRCLDWIDVDGRQQRRFLGVFTQSVLASVLPEKIDPNATLAAIDALLANLYPVRPCLYTLDILLADARAWHREHLPDPLHVHVAGWVPMSSLPRRVLAREESQQALKADASREEKSVRPEGFHLALGAYLDQSGHDHGSWLISELVDICRQDRSQGNAQDRKRMLEGCLALAQRADDAGPISALILAWAIDLLESGTRRKAQIRAGSASKYVRKASNLLHLAFRDLDVETLAPAQFREIYRRMLDGLTPSQARTLASALSSWHFFLMTWFEVEPLGLSLHKWLRKTPPKANLLWPLEVDRIRSWLAVDDTDDRMVHQVKVAFEILAVVRIRANELLSLRIQNIALEAGVAQIEITTAARDGGLKSEAARRIQTSDDPKTVEILQEWISRRRGEGALPSDYLFGDPYRPDKKYRSGQLYVSLNRVLKAVTGDVTVASHALSHTYISFRWLEATRKRIGTDINPFEQLASAAGHESPHTGFSVYFHFPEIWLRESLDKILAAHLQRWPTVSNWVNLSHDAFRQARARWLKQHPDASAGEAALHFIRRSIPAQVDPGAAKAIPVCVPEKPSLFVGRSALPLAKALDLLNDIQFGHSVQAIALRCDLPTTHVATISEIARQHLERLAEGSRHGKPATDEASVSLLHQWLNPAGGRRIDFSRTGQGKVVDLYDYLNNHLENDVSQAGIGSWQNCYRRGYLSLESPPFATGIIGLLEAAEVPRSLLVVREVTDLAPRIQAHIRALLQTGTVAQPCFESIRPRYGRPPAYLAIASYLSAGNTKGPRGNAALGMTGINALLLASAVCLDFNATQHEREARA